MSEDPLLKFYSGGRDSEGRTLDQILSWDDEQLEFHHDFIQWLFPNDVPSGVNPDAPLVTARDREEFARRPELRDRLLKAFRRMLAFYGFELIEEQGKPKVIRPSNWPAHRRQWVRPHDHNHLRITRILIALRLLGLPELAKAFFDALDELCHSEEGSIISKTAYDFWKSAVYGAHGLTKSCATESPQAQ